MNKFQDSVKKYLDIYRDQETYFLNDTKNIEFFKANPSNTRLGDIIQKLSVMDDAEFNRLAALDAMAEHILKLNIDPRLTQHDLSVVEDVANVTVYGNPKYFLHVASMYCNLHHPDVYPIYSDEYASFYKRYFTEHQLPLNPEQINRYDIFSKALNDLVARYGLKGKLNYLQIRKFAWTYGGKVLEEQ